MIDDYVDEDVAYLIGLITARGIIRESSGRRQIIIEFPFKGLEAIGIKKKIVQKSSIKLSLIDVIKRVSELTDANVRQEEERNSIRLIIESLKNTLFWRNIRLILGNKTSFNEFDISKVIFNSPEIIQKEFIRGFADVAGSARYANRDIAGKCRIYLDILNPNWTLPSQICYVLQDGLGVPVQSIIYGHPNLRDPQLKDYKTGKRETWAREHQIRVYAENFLKIGFYIKHKQEILEELSKYNMKKFGKSKRFCSPPKTRVSKKPKHPDEKSGKLHPKIRKKHYNAYWQICCDLGCIRCKKQMRLNKIRKKGA